MEYQDFKNGRVYKGDCLEVIDYIKEFDCVLTDPPYGYLKHRIETFFDHKILFPKIREKISPKGAFLIFGRGDLFYEWNLYLRDLGFEHKEDCVLYKNQPANIFNDFMRYGEYFSIRGLDGFTINKVNIPITDKDNVTDNQIADWHRRSFTNGKYIEEVKEYLDTGVMNYNQEMKCRELVVANNSSKSACNGVKCLKSLLKGKVLSNVLQSSRELLEEGSHPTIKPSKELGYLAQAISNENDTILDPFLGSGSLAIAVINVNRNTGSNRKFVGIELDSKYFDLSCKRLEEYERNYLFQ